MSAKGDFEVDLAPQPDSPAPAGRMILNKTYRGDMSGSGVGQMISKRTDNGTAIYFAIEEFSGSVDGRSGAFTLVHRGLMNAEAQSLEITILQGSGSGELATITGSMLITQSAGEHSYDLRYEL